MVLVLNVYVVLPDSDGISVGIWVHTGKRKTIGTKTFLVICDNRNVATMTIIQALNFCSKIKNIY